MISQSTLRQVGGFHLVATVVAALLFGFEFGLTDREALGALIVAYNLGLPVFFYRRGDLEIVELWAFLLPLSLLQVVPDWYLVSVQKTLAFPATTGPFAWLTGAFPVPWFMAGLWTFPLVLTTAAGLHVRRRIGRFSGYLAALVVGLAVFAGGELYLTHLGIWEARRVATIRGLALYILPAELMLAAATLYAYAGPDWRSPVGRLAAVPVVMLVYLGSAATSYLLVEHTDLVAGLL